jgi:hypothetical protein
VHLANRAETTRFAWIDETGTEFATVGTAGIQQSVQLSPNRQSLVFAREATTLLRDLARGVEIPLVENLRGGSVWSPDSRYVSFGRVNAGDIFIKDLATGKEEQVPFETQYVRIPSDWSLDGGVLFYTEGSPKTQPDIWALIDPLNRSNQRRAVPFVVTPAVESQAQVSPDGRWVAYTSDDTGQWVIYAKRFPDGPRVRISPAEGREPRWSVDGRELYYLSGLTGRHALNAVSIEATTPELRIGKVQRMFEFPSRPFVPQANIFQYDVGAERRRFLVNVLTSDVQPTLNVITNWHALAK